MTEEEKRAIEIYEEDIRIAREYYENEEDFKADGEYNKVILLNLIEKLKKENEELKNKVIKRDNDIIYLEETAEKEFLTKQEVKENYISKEKVREKIEAYNHQRAKAETKQINDMYVNYIDVLNELLEEE